MVSPKPAKLGLLSAKAHIPSTKVCSHHLWRCMGSQPWVRKGWSTWSIAGAHGPVEGFIENVSQTTHGPAFLWRLWHFCHPLMSSKVLVAMCQPLSYADYLSLLGETRKKCLLTTVLRKAGAHSLCSRFPLREKLWVRGKWGYLGTELSCLRRRVM